MAEAALADLFIFIPKMMFLAVYLGILRYGWILVILVAFSWLVHGMVSYYRQHHDNADEDELLQGLLLLPSHRLMTGIGIVALAWLLLARVFFGGETLASLEAHMAKAATPMSTPAQPSPPIMVNPFGGAWPDRMGYLPGSPLLARNGNATLLVSNAESDLPVYVKLCHYGEEQCQGLRHAYIGGRWYFRFEQVTPGEYELRYRQTNPATVAARSGRIEIVYGNPADNEVKVQIPPQAPTANATDGIFTIMDIAAF